MPDKTVLSDRNHALLVALAGQFGTSDLVETRTDDIIHELLRELVRSMPGRTANAAIPNALSRSRLSRIQREREKHSKSDEAA